MRQKLDKTLYSKENKLLVDKIIELRKKAGFQDQRSFAKALGRPQSIVGSIETGNRRVDFVEFYKICQICGADPGKEANKLMKEFQKI